MTDEENKVATGEVEDTTENYIDTIKKLKENTVDRKKYEEVITENKKLLDSIVNGQGEEQVKAEVVPTVDELREDLFGPKSEGMSNLDYITKALELRRQLIQKGEPDPFLPVGKRIAPEQSDIEAANRVAQVFQECIEYAEGDNAVFTNELQRRTIDVRLK